MTTEDNRRWVIPTRRGEMCACPNGTQYNPSPHLAGQVAVGCVLSAYPMSLPVPLNTTEPWAWLSSLSPLDRVRGLASKINVRSDAYAMTPERLGDPAVWIAELVADAERLLAAARELHAETRPVPTDPED